MLYQKKSLEDEYFKKNCCAIILDSGLNFAPVPNQLNLLIKNVLILRATVG